MTEDEYGKAYEKGYLYTAKYLIKKGVAIDEAYDCAQEAWGNGWNKIHQLREPKFLLTWVTKSAVNIFLLRLRKSHRCFELPQDLDVLEYPWQALENKLEIEKILSRLHPIHRKVLLLNMEGWSAEEIAVQQGISHITARVRLLRARKSAREIFS